MISVLKWDTYEWGSVMSLNGEVEGLGMGKWSNYDRELECLVMGEWNGHQLENDIPRTQKS